MIGVPSIFSVIRKVEVLVRVLSTFAFRVTENTARWKSTGGFRKVNS